METSVLRSQQFPKRFYLNRVTKFAFAVLVKSMEIVFAVFIANCSCFFSLRHFSQLSIILLKLAVTVFTSLLFQTLWPNWLPFIFWMIKIRWMTKRSSRITQSWKSTVFKWCFDADFVCLPYHSIEKHKQCTMLNLCLWCFYPCLVTRSWETRLNVQNFTEVLLYGSYRV